MTKKVFFNVSIEVYTTEAFHFELVRIRNGFNEKPDPTFYLNSNSDPDLVSRTIPMRIHDDPYPCQILPSQKVGYLHEKCVLRTGMWLKGHNTYQVWYI
jgi:hypothetical protein